MAILRSRYAIFYTLAFVPLSLLHSLCSSLSLLLELHIDTFHQGTCNIRSFVCLQPYVSLSLSLSVSFTLSLCLPAGNPLHVTVTSAATGGIKSASRVAGFVVYQR